ncbi:MAG: HMA2 domain-containing protein [Desulfobaccales bacterium]
MQDIEVIASRPGQVSLTITRVKGNEVLARELQDRLGAIRGIHQVEADAVQGLVSIDYDRQRLSSVSFLLQLKETFSSLFPEISVTQLAATISRSL